MTFLESIKAVCTTNVEDTSKRGSLDTTDLLKLLRHAGTVAAGAGITYILSNLQLIQLGEYTPLLVPMVSVVLNAILKYMKDNEAT